MAGAAVPTCVPPGDGVVLEYACDLDQDDGWLHGDGADLRSKWNEWSNEDWCDADAEVSRDVCDCMSRSERWRGAWVVLDMGLRTVVKVIVHLSLSLSVSVSSLSAAMRVRMFVNATVR